LNASVRINADDFGWTDGHNMAVERAYSAQAVHSASLMCTGGAFPAAAALARSLPGLQVGVHLVLNETPPVLPSGKLHGLLNSKGAFPDSLVELAARLVVDRQNSRWVQTEWRAQVEGALQAGIQISHLDSHKHVHVLPPLLPVAVALAEEYGISYLRLPLEDFSGEVLRRGPAGIILWLLAKRARPVLQSAGLRFANHFVGIGSSGAMNGPRLSNLLTNLRPGLTEIMVHPAVITPGVATLQKRYRWAAHYQFEDELKALLCMAGNGTAKS
jgi:predicted glycoside hydrolase/deacetylase ChbG (UPF0249 family)